MRTPACKPLAPMRSHVQVLSGLAHLNANAGNDGGGDHARGNEIGRASCRERVSKQV